MTGQADTGALHYTAPCDPQWHLHRTDMAATAVRHSVPVALKVRHAGHGTGRYEATLAPYYSVSHLVTPPEMFGWNCWRDSLARRHGRHLPVLRGHKSDAPIGHAEAFDDRRDGLHATLVIKDDDTLDAIGRGVLTGVSVGFKMLDFETTKENVRIVTRAELAEASVVSVPAYHAAGINGPAAPDPAELVKRDAADWQVRRMDLEYRLKYRYPTKVRGA